MKPERAHVLLTGATGGIGRAVNQALRAAGAQVIGVGRGASPPADSGPGWVSADLCSDEGVAAAAAAARQWDVNVVVHAAGVPSFGALECTTPQRMRDVIATNLLAPMRLTQALLPALRRQSRAQIVFVGSALGRIGLPGFSLYGASKAGLHGFAEALRRELADTSVRVQLLAPRSTRTGFNGAAVQAYNQATGTAMDDPSVVADALVALIASEAAERFIGFPERLGVRLNSLFGAWLDGSFTKHRRSLPATPIDDPLNEGNTA
jgi:short-subunit dehydrogenase